MSMSFSEPTVLSYPEEQTQSDKSVAYTKDGDIHLGVLNDLVGYQIRRAQLRIYNSFAKKLEHTQITPAQMGLLIKIKYNEGISQTALAKANGIERSTLGEIIDRFEKRGLVERRKHATDRRAYALHLSAAGEDILTEILPLVVEHEKAVFKHWSEADRQTLLQLLTRLGDQAEA